MVSPILRISKQSSIDGTPKARVAAGREPPAHEEGEGPGPSKPREVVSKVTSHRIDQARAQHRFPNPGSERVSTFSAPPRPWSSNECHMLGGTFPENKIPQTKLTARCRQDCVNREESEHVGQRDPCGRGTRPRERPSVQLTPLPGPGGRPSGPGAPPWAPALSLPLLLRPAPPSPPTVGCWPGAPAAGALAVCGCCDARDSQGAAEIGTCIISQRGVLFH